MNPLLFNVDLHDVYEVPPGFVAVLRSNIGEELDRSDVKPTPVSDAADFDQTVHSVVEMLLTPDRTRRGIWQNPVAPGKYNLNPIAFTAYLVPTSAIMVDWASSQHTNAPSMPRPSTQPTIDTAAYPYITDDTAKGVSFFQFTQLKVTSKDGFQLEVDVRMVIRSGTTPARRRPSSSSRAARSSSRRPSRRPGSSSPSTWWRPRTS